MTTTTSEDLPGVLRRDGARVAVAFERRYSTDAVDLWTALTDPTRLARWLGRVEAPSGPGGRYRIDFSDDPDTQDPDDVTTGEVEHCDPPHRLVLTWELPGEPVSRVEVTLEEVSGGTVLHLDHRQLPPAQGAGYGAGWHAHLSGLARALADGPGGSWEDDFAAALPGYTEQLTALT
jgi:uncharacterized protein YndB with AHSA1/START domain